MSDVWDARVRRAMKDVYSLQRLGECTMVALDCLLVMVL